MKQRLNTCAAFLMAVASLSSAPGAIRATLDGELEPIWNLELEEYPVTILYESRLPIDQATLGNEDLHMGNGPYPPHQVPDDLGGFLGHNGFGATAELRQIHTLNAAGTKLRVDYVIKRPVIGWENLSHTRIRIVEKTVADVSGSVIAQHPLGTAYAGLETVATLISSNLDVSQDAHAFQVRFVNPSGITEAEVAAIEIVNYSSANSLAQFVGIEPQVSADVLVANYQLQKPSGGWRSQETTQISYPGSVTSVTHVFEYGALLMKIDNGASDAPTRSINSILGEITWRRLPDIDVRVDTSPLLHPVEALNRFNIHFQTISRAFDLSSFGDGNVELHTNPAFRSGHSLATKLIALTETPGEIIATYEAVPPSQGWDETYRDHSDTVTLRVWHQHQAIHVVLLENQIFMDDGTAVPSTVFSEELTLDHTSDTSPLQSDFDAWTRNLIGALGVTQEEAFHLDFDRDGMTVAMEYALARNPLKADQTAPLTPKRVQIGGTVYLELKYRQRKEAKGVLTQLQGSPSGKTWHLAEEHFEIIARDKIPYEQAEILTLRSKRPVTELTDKLYRLHVTLDDSTND